MTRKKFKLPIFLMIAFFFYGLNLSASLADENDVFKEKSGLAIGQADPVLVADQFSMASQQAKPEISGELKKWHKVTLTFDGPFTSETDKWNPFMNYRLNVVFTHKKSGKSFTVPGYFAADGNAAESSAVEGNKWRVHFAPDETGTWEYVVDFRKGRFSAVS